MDIEGFEIEVFDNLKDSYFDTNRPTILFEVHTELYTEERDLKYIQKVLNKNKYHYRRIGGNLLCYPY